MTRSLSTVVTKKYLLFSSRARTLQYQFWASNEPFLDRLDIFSDATDLKNTLVLLFLRHLPPQSQINQTPPRPQCTILFVHHGSAQQPFAAASNIKQNFFADIHKTPKHRARRPVPTGPPELRAAPTTTATRGLLSVIRLAKVHTPARPTPLHVC